MASFPRSTARVYWIRSFVPMLTKSVSCASWSILNTEAGVSIMMPRGTPAAMAIPSFLSWSFTRSTISRARRRSSRPSTIGNITFTFPYAEARKMARSWVTKISWRRSEKRSPRMPRNGFFSIGVPR